VKEGFIEKIFNILQKHRGQGCIGCFSNFFEQSLKPILAKLKTSPYYGGV
jgi:hypothetical protein